MKTNLLFTVLMLGISISASCMTAKDLVNPYYPKHIYGDVKLDSVVEGSRWGEEYHILFDEKGRMAVQNMYMSNEETNQYKLIGTYEFGYAEGIMFTSTHVHYWEEEDSKWIDYFIKFEDIVYDDYGNQISYTMLEWDTTTNKWEQKTFNEIHYDLRGNVVYERDSVLEKGEAYVRETTYEYVYDNEGKVLTLIGSNDRKIEYTYNSNGDILTETEYYLFINHSYDGEKEELVPDTTWNISYFRQYSYNTLSNLEKCIEYDSNRAERNHQTYHYSSLQAIDQISQGSRTKSQKLIKDGQILILRGDKVFTVIGQRL